MFRNLSTDGLGISGRSSEIIELALSFGFKGIELDIKEFAGQVQTHSLAHARRLVDSAKLKYSTFRLPLVWDDDEEQYRQGLAGLSAAASLAAEVGCKRCLTRIAPANDSRPYHENFEFHRRRITEIAEVLAPLGIRLGLEFDAAEAQRKDRAFQFIHSLDAVILLTSMLRPSNVGVVLDVWHMHVAGSSVEETRKLRGDRIVAVYLSDAAAKGNGSQPSETSRVLPGETGVIDCPAILTALAELGYDGPVTAIAHRDRFQGMRRDAIVKLAGEKLDEVWKAVGLNTAGKLATAAGKK